VCPKPPAGTSLEHFALMGSSFRGANPNLVRLLMPDDCKGHPLRKAYPDRRPSPPRLERPIADRSRTELPLLSRLWPFVFRRRTKLAHPAALPNDPDSRPAARTVDIHPDQLRVRFEPPLDPRRLPP